MVSLSDLDRPHAAFADWLNRRMGALRIPKHKRASALAKMFDISPQGARKWLSGRALPETPRIAFLVDAYGDPDDLDPILRRGPPESRREKVPLAPAHDPLEADKRAMLEILDHLDPEQRATLRRVGSAFVEQAQKQLKDGTA